MFIDTHCHLFKDDYDNIDEVINEMKNNIMIVNGCDNKTNHEVIELVNKYPNVYGCLGLHPEDLDNIKEEDFEYIIDNIDNPKIVGIGEIGLDYYYTKDNRDLQLDLFKKQLDIALKYNKTVVIHSRDAIKDTIDILNNYNLKVILHCYSGSLETAKELIKKNVKLGIGGIITFKNSLKLKEIVENLDLSNFVLETDSPYLAPVPFRGTHNKPIYCQYIAQEIANIKNIDVNDVYKITTENAIKQFDLKI